MESYRLSILYIILICLALVSSCSIRDRKETKIRRYWIHVPNSYMPAKLYVDNTGIFNSYKNYFTLVKKSRVWQSLSSCDGAGSLTTYIYSSSRIKIVFVLKDSSELIFIGYLLSGNYLYLVKKEVLDEENNIIEVVDYYGYQVVLEGNPAFSLAPPECI